MTSENTDAVENSATETPASTPATKRPRRATRAATAPAEAAGTSAAVPTGATPAVEPSTGTAAPEVAAEKPVAAPRRRTRKAATTEDASAASGDAPSGSATAEVAESSPAPVKKATRSRKKAVAPADAVAEVVATGATETGTTETGATEAAAEAPAPKKRPSRAKKKPATDAVPAAGEAPAVSEAPAAEVLVAAQAPVTGTPASADAPAAPKRRRATRKAAAPSDAPTSDAPTDGAGSTASASASGEVATPETATPEAAVPQTVTTDAAVSGAAVSEGATPAADPADASAPPARRTRSRRATRPAAAAETPAAPVVEQPDEPVEAEEDEETAEPTADAQGAALDVLAAFSGVTPEPEKPTASSGRLATTALLFQAPETTPRRRRRASAPAGSPEEIAAAAHVEAAAEPEAVAEDTAENAESTGGSRRSRGRRGGRKRSGQQAEETVEEATEATPVEAEDEAAEDQTAEQSEGEDTEDGEGSPRRRRRRGGRGRRSRAKDSDESGDADDESGAEEDDESAEDQTAEDTDSDDEGSGGSSRRRRRRRRSSRGGDGESGSSSSSGRSSSSSRDEVTALRGSTRLEAKRQRRREGRDAGRRRQIITEAEFLARRESVDRSMIVRELDGRTQIAVLEDGVLVEHYVSKQAQASMVGNVYLGRVQNVLPSMEAAFVDVGRGRNAVLYAGEVNWDAAGVEGGKTRRIEQALKSGDPVLVQVTKDPIGHKGARLTSQITLAGRYLVYVPGGGMTGISRKLPDNERSRLKKILREVVPDSAGVIVRTAAEGASEEELRADIARLQSQWEAIEKKSTSASAPSLLQGEPDMAIRVVRDIFNDDFNSLVIQGDEAWSTISGYIGELAPDLAEKVTKYTGTGDVFHDHRVDEQLAKGMDRKVWLPSGGSLVIDRTEAMTVVDVNTGKFTGAGGTLEETVTRNNLEAAEEIVRQLRLRDIGGIIVIDFIDMVLESNRDLVLRRLVECLGRDRTKHQVAEVTSLGLVQMTRKRVGQGLVEAFSETCEHCHGRGFIVHTEPVEKSGGNGGQHQHQHQPQPEKSPAAEGEPKRSRRKRGGSGSGSAAAAPAADKDQAGVPVLPEAREQVNATLATIAAAAAHAHQHEEETPVATPESTVVAASATAEVSAEAERPYLDVFAALGELGATGADPAGPVVEDSSLALTPVDPSLFEDGEPMPETSIEELSVEDQAAEQQEQ